MNEADLWQAELDRLRQDAAHWRALREFTDSDVVLENVQSWLNSKPQRIEVTSADDFSPQFIESIQGWLLRLLLTIRRESGQ